MAKVLAENLIRSQDGRNVRAGRSVLGPAPPGRTIIVTLLGMI